jgi:1,4-dihydroxy-2-naphthoyl-CoA hydrolase
LNGIQKDFEALHLMNHEASMTLSEARRANRDDFFLRNVPVSTDHSDHSTERFNAYGAAALPGLLGIVIDSATKEEIRASLRVRPELMAPNGFLHAGTIISMADTACGYGCVFNLPPGAIGFTTIETKSNHLSTLRDGFVACRATPAHLGRSTQVWDAVVENPLTGKPLAMFRCTQLLLYPTAGAP